MLEDLRTKLRVPDRVHARETDADRLARFRLEKFAGRSLPDGTVRNPTNQLTPTDDDETM